MIVPLEAPALYEIKGDYKNAWNTLERLSRKLNKLWKSKKSGIQILKEERKF